MPPSPTEVVLACTDLTSVPHDDTGGPVSKIQIKVGLYFSTVLANHNTKRRNLISRKTWNNVDPRLKHITLYYKL